MTHMSSYNLDKAKQLIENRDFDNLNILLTNLINNEIHTFKDMEILKCILDSDCVSLESKQKIKVLYLKYKKEIEERIFSGDSVKNVPYTESIDIKPSSEKNDDFAFINFKTVILIIILTILVIGAITFLTLRG